MDSITRNVSVTKQTVVLQIITGRQISGATNHTAGRQKIPKFSHKTHSFIFVSIHYVWETRYHGFVIAMQTIQTILIDMNLSNN